MLLCEFEELIKEERTSLGQDIFANKDGKKMVTKVALVIFASAEEHGIPHLELTCEVVSFPLDPGLFR